MKILIILFLFNLIVIFSADFAAAENISKNQFFTAQIKNIRKSTNGKVFVTVSFISNLAAGNPMALYNKDGSEGRYRDEISACKQAVKLIDENGNEYGSSRCLPFRSFNQYRTDGMSVDQKYENTFVFEFMTPYINNTTSLNNVNVIIPIDVACMINGQYLGTVVNLSFYNLSI